MERCITNNKEMKDAFCDNCHLTLDIPRFVAGKLLGVATEQLIDRYKVMRDNFDRDSSGGCCIKCTPPLFKSDFSDKKTIGLDLPTWFNVENAEERIIMLIAQSPLRDNDLLYDKRHKVTVSSPFGLHDAEYRGKPKGGQMMHTLVQKLVASGYGVYLTDAYKFFVDEHDFTIRYSKKKAALYADILEKEIKEVKPSWCVCLGREAQHTFKKISSVINLDKEHVIELPLLTGTARGAIVKEFDMKSRGIEANGINIVEQYAKAIIGEISK